MSVRRSSTHDLKKTNADVESRSDLIDLLPLGLHKVAMALNESSSEEGSPPRPPSSTNGWQVNLQQWLARFRVDDDEDANASPAASWQIQLKRFLARLDSATKSKIVGIAAFFFWSFLRYRRQRRRLSHYSAVEAPLSTFLSSAKGKDIEQALVSSSGVYYRVKGDWKRSNIPSSMSMMELLETLKGCDDVSALPESLVSRLSTPALASLPFVYLFFMYRILRSTVTDKGINLQSSSTTTFADVAGLDAVIEDVREVVEYLRNPMQYRSLGARPPRAILLHGPPGNGKTLLAQAVAGEAGVPFLACSASEFVEVYVGRGAARVRSLFSQARNEAKRQAWWERWLRTSDDGTTKAAILFIDEIDALAKSRSALSTNDEREQTLNQLLTEMDGFATNTDVELIVMAASNRADVLDPAILRRFDRQLHVAYPDEAGRRAILQIHARRIRCGVVDWARLASDQRTGDFSGADLRNLVNDAALLAVREQSLLVEQRHLEHAARRVNQMKWKETTPAPMMLIDLPSPNGASRGIR